VVADSAAQLPTWLEISAPMAKRMKTTNIVQTSPDSI
jgi:hypothetical protein